MTPLGIVIILLVGIVLGVVFGIKISNVLIKRHQQKIKEQAAGKILKQKQVNFKDVNKPVDLNFTNDGKKVDFKKEVREGLAQAKLKEIKEKPKKEVKKDKKKVKK